jgi:Fe-S-cluster containining protein
MTDAARLLPRPRHACQGCGGCCHGVRVLVLDAERDGVERAAEALGVAAPLDGPYLAQIDGRCAFLRPDLRCGIHLALGEAAKPALCRQYPLVVVRGLDGFRAGIDPGAYEAWQGWQDGPEPGRDVTVAVAEHPEDRALLARERDLAERLEVDDLRAAIEAIGADAGRFAARLAALLRAAPVPAVLAATPGPVTRAHLSRLLRGARGWRRPRPPWPSTDAWALHATRSHLLLRLGHADLTPDQVAVAMLAGALAAGWSSPAPAQRARTLSAWSRCIRVRDFVDALFGGGAGLDRFAGSVST